MGRVHALRKSNMAVLPKMAAHSVMQKTRITQGIQ